MRSALVLLCVGLLLVVPAARAQNAGSNSGGNNAIGTSLAEQQPAANVRGGAVQARAPGQIIKGALARHRNLRDLRLGAQRTHETYRLAPEPGAAGGLSNLLGGSLSNLIGSFLNTGLAGAFGNLAGGSSGSATGAATSGTAGNDLSNLPPEVIQMLEAFGIDPKDLTQSSRENPGSAQAPAGLTQSKTSSRAQTIAPQEEPDFIVRWADAMLSTFFTALTVGFQTPDFIGLLEDLLRPIINPQAASNGSTDSGTGGGGGGSGI